MLTAALGDSSLDQADSQRLDSMILNLTESQDKLYSLTCVAQATQSECVTIFKRNRKGMLYCGFLNT